VEADMHDRHILSAGILTGLLVLAAGRLAAAPEEWPPITDEEKAMKDCPQQPGAPAVFLYREEITDDNTWTTTYYCRLKILTAAGKERANIEIPFVKGSSKIKDLEARVVRPNGASVEFAGQVFDKTALRAGGFKVTVKTLALPDVDVGSIIDYRYKNVPDEGESPSAKSLEALETLFGRSGKPQEGGIDTEAGVFFFPVKTWDIQEDLFTRKAKFTYDPSDFLEDWFSLAYKRMRLNWVTHGIEGAKPARKKGRIELELENIPAFEPEEYMIPESTQRMEVRIFYLEGAMAAPDQYWKEESRNWQKGAEKFMRKAGDATAEAQKLITGIDDPAMKLKALYGRAQEIKNLSYDKTLTKQRRKELKIRDNRSVADVLKNNYGLRSDITRTFAAMASATGFDARVIRVVTRDDKFFDKNLCGLYNQFDTELAMVRVNGRDLLFDPATPYCPLGLVRWNCTGTTCLAPSENPPSFLTTPAYPADTALTQREIALRLDLEGNLAGTAKISFTGQEALVRRLEHIGDDEVEVKKDMEAELSAILPAGAKVTLQKLENINNSADCIWAHFDISIPGISTSAGQRVLLPVSPLLGDRQHPFRHAQRKYPVYFPYPYREFNDIVVALPAEMKVETCPSGRKLQRESFNYSLVCVVEGGTKLHAQRDLVIKKSFFPVDQYPVLKSFFDQVRAGDEEQVVLSVEKK
jgi:hypothetical protein